MILGDRTDTRRATLLNSVALLVIVLGGCSNDVADSLMHCDSDGADLVTTFEIDELPGLTHEMGVSRRDPSDVIVVDEAYYVWYTKSVTGFSGYNATIWFAKSMDGESWSEVGEVLSIGEPGGWDSYSVFTPNVLKANNKIYLYYTGVSPTPGNDEQVFENNSESDTTAIGVAVADSPDGPFHRVSDQPVLQAGSEHEEFDSYRVDDAALMRREGHYWLYYKGRSRVYGTDGPKHTKMGVAFSESPDGPFLKHKDNPLTNGGHEIIVWPFDGGVMTFLSEHGADGNTVQFAQDGLKFEIQGRFDGSYPKAPGSFQDDDFQDGARWGISMRYGEGETWPHLVRYNVSFRRCN